MDNREQEAREISELIKLYWKLGRDDRIHTLGYMRGLIDESKIRRERTLPKVHDPKGSDADAK